MNQSFKGFIHGSLYIYRDDLKGGLISHFESLYLFYQPRRFDNAKTLS